MVMNFMIWQRIYYNRNFHICVLRYSKQFFAIKKIIFWKLIFENSYERQQKKKETITKSSLNFPKARKAREGVLLCNLLSLKIKSRVIKCKLSNNRFSHLLPLLPYERVKMYQHFLF